MNRVFAYGLAVAAPVIAAVIRGPLLSAILGDRGPTAIFILAVSFTAWVGGFFPGMLATAVSMILACIFFVTPDTHLLPERLTLLVVFGLSGTAISLICESLHRSRRQAEAAWEALKKGQREVKESEERFRRLADSAPVLIWMSDETGCSTWFNRHWLEFTGRTMWEEKGFGWMQGVHPEDLDRCRAVWRRSFKERSPFSQDYRLRRHDGVYRWIADQGSPNWSADGVFLGFLGGCIDITDRKEAEESREILLQIEQSAREEAERITRLKDEFLATVSHEMRTPLTAMLGWVQLLRGGKVRSEAIPQALEIIERNARAQSKLIDELLDMSRIISGQMRLTLQPVNLKSLIEAAIAAVEPSAAAKEIHIAKELDSSPRGMSGDPDRLQQIIWNLLTNAVKFTPPKGNVTVALEFLAETAEITVADSGDGISADFLPFVFDRFRQQDSSTARRHQGLGLGLAIIRQLAELHGGSIAAASDGPGCGSVFTVRLPIREVPPVVPSPVEPPPDVSLHGLEVLVVDDDGDTLEVLRSMLVQSGASVRTVASAAEAVQQMSKHRPDVIVSDVGMPVEDGYSMIRRIRQLVPEMGGAVPAIALTAFTGAGNERMAIEAGFQRHLAKPVEPALLVYEVSKVARMEIQAFS